MHLNGKKIGMSFNGKKLAMNGQKIYVYENIWGPRGLPAPAPGLYTCV